jgi:hypothetical protein
MALCLKEEGSTPSIALHHDAAPVGSVYFYFIFLQKKNLINRGKGFHPGYKPS